MNTGSTKAESGASRFSRHVLWTLIARAVMAVGTLLSGVIIARWLGTASVGIMSTLSVISLLALNIGGVGFPSATTFIVARDRKIVGPAILNAFLFALVS